VTEARPNGQTHVFTSESVTEGHPDKVCDFIADSILDAYIADDPHSHVACEVLCKGKRVVLAGEITSKAGLKKARYEEIVRETIDGIPATFPIRKW
jgi:S-adenosylmethionine synthetase